MGADGDRCSIPGLRDQSVRLFGIVQMLVGQDREPRVEDIRATAGRHRVDGHDDSSLETLQLGVSGC